MILGMPLSQSLLRTQTGWKGIAEPTRKVLRVCNIILTFLKIIIIPRNLHHQHLQTTAIMLHSSVHNQISLYIQALPILFRSKIPPPNANSETLEGNRCLDASRTTCQLELLHNAFKVSLPYLSLPRVRFCRIGPYENSTN